MVDKTDSKAERVIAPAKLRNIIKQTRSKQSEMAKSRGELGDLIKKYEADEGLNVQALRMVLPLEKMDAAKASRILRHFTRYCEMLEIGGQSDLVDAIDEAKAADEPVAAWAKIAGAWATGVILEEHEDGSAEIRLASGAVAHCAKGQWTIDDPMSTSVASILGSKSKGESADNLTLGMLRNALASAETPEAINAGLGRFIEDNPRLADQAAMLAAERLAAIDVGSPPADNVVAMSPPAAPKRTPGEARKAKRAKAVDAKEAADRAVERSEREAKNRFDDPPSKAVN